MAITLKILFVEDLITDFELALYEIKKVRPDINFKRVETRDDYVDALKNFMPDIIISDYILPLFSGMTALVIKKEISPDIPFIMLTGSTNEETAVECMKTGADDYVIKEHIKRLPHSLINALENAAARKEIKETHKELFRREFLLRNAVNNLPSTFTVYDNQGRIEYINEYGLIISNLTSKEAVGKREEEIFPPEITQGYLSLLYKAFETKETEISECLVNYRNYQRYMIYYFVPSLDEDNNIYKVLGIAYDITERKEAEEKINMAMKKVEETDRLKSAFLANISHEIRTPLNAIMGFAQMIRRYYTNDEQLESYVDVIMLSSNQLLDIIKDMLEISQLVSGKSNLNNSLFSLSELMNELLLSFRLQEESKIMHGIAFTLDIQHTAKKDELIFSDKEKLHQILRSLLSNAFKFTYSGKISFGYQLSEPGILHFFVSDTGIGIEEDKLEVIFHAFRQGDDSFTRQYGGVGLGLTICREMVTLLGGKIWVESKQGKGSTFYFLLPVRKKPADY